MAQRSIQQLVGTWVAVDAKNENAGLEIADTSHIFLVYGAEKKSVAAFRFDFTKSPAWFDFTLRENGESLKVKSLLTFVSDDLIQWLSLIHI